jgi:ABC-type uncharacterized transport system permease subunit
MPSLDLHFTTAVLYVLTAIVAWWSVSDAALVSAGSQSGATLNGRRAILRGMLATALVTHGAALGFSLFGGEGLNIGFSHAVSLIVWLVVLAYTLIGFDNQLLRIVALYLAPLAAVVAMLPMLLPAHRIVNYAAWAFKMHFVVAILAYSLYTVATLHALLMLFLEKHLHEGSLPQMLQGLPPLMRLEKLLFQLLEIAFLLLTATLLSGIFFSESLFGKPFQVTYKTVFAALSWVIFGGLLFGQLKFGWRGKLAVRWTLIGFVLLLLSYVGSKFVSEIILQRV